MFLLRRAFILSQNVFNKADLPLQNQKKIKYFVSSYSTRKKNLIMDPKRVVSYEDMLKVINEPLKLIIDVRSPDEVRSTGMIPSSINIPLGDVKDVLESMTNDEFRRRFKRDKPLLSDEIIFYCRSGKRSTVALDQALQLGYSNCKNYVGSWSEWSSKRK